MYRLLLFHESQRGHLVRSVRELRCSVWTAAAAVRQQAVVETPALTNLVDKILSVFIIVLP